MKNRTQQLHLVDPPLHAKYMQELDDITNDMWVFVKLIILGLKETISELRTGIKLITSNLYSNTPFTNVETLRQ